MYARIWLGDMGSPASYVEKAAAAGMRFKQYVDFTEQISNHYGTPNPCTPQGQSVGQMHRCYVQRARGDGFRLWLSSFIDFLFPSAHWCAVPRVSWS